MSSPLHGGKTPPRLIDDLSLYNPTRLPNSRYNILTELALPFVANAPPVKTTGRNACHHKWMLKPGQSSPVLLENNTQAGEYNLAAFCSECRTHLLLNLTLKSRDGNVAKFCPSDEGILHHFRFVPEHSPGLQVRGQNAKTDDWEDTQAFQCSVQACSAHLLIRLRSPRVRREWIELLANRSTVAQRAQDAMEADPNRLQGHPIPTPTTVLATLKTYIGNALKGEGKIIAGDNKRFVLALGDSCSDMLETLGFQRQEEGWNPPKPDLNSMKPFSSPLNILLDDVEKELAALITRQPEDDRRMARVDATLAPAMKFIQPFLGYKNYHTDPANRAVDLTRAEHPYYAGLGSVVDFHDALISYAYEQQCAIDRPNIPYYVECFRGIAEGRGSQDLQFKAAVDASTGKKAMPEIRKAYKTFGLDADDPVLEDDTIIGTFHSRLSDSRRQEAELRDDLKAIGQYRNSEKIQQVAENRINTYEEALEWLGFSKDETPDDSFVSSMFQVKVSQEGNDLELGRKCVSILAEHRNSNALRDFLRTGQLGDTEMDPAQAYARLNISDRSVDDETVKVAYDALASDAPAIQLPDLRKALVAIAKDRNSTFLQGCVGGNVSNGDHHDLAKWPVGLENIGNTCYLNSLLQFYFTIRPLRELVLHFEEHKMDIDSGEFARKQVGSRQVSKKEVQRAQRFVNELRRLFQDMIKSDQRQVVPEQELARLTLLSSSIEEIFRRRSTLQSPRPALGEIDGRLVHGPLPPPIPESHKEGPESAATIQENPEKPAPGAAEGEIVMDDTSSDGTLVEKPQSPEETDLMIVDSPTEIQQQQQQQVLEDKENLAPSKQEEVRPSTPDSSLKPLGEASPSRINQRSPPKNTSPVRAESSTEPPSRIPGPPNRPPPVPPRDKKPANKEEIQRELEFGAQQDVTEAISNVLFQLSCAIKGAGVDGDGEQIDTIKELFFGKQKTVTTNKDGVARTKEELFSDVKVQVVDGPRDLYQALDAAFDEEEVDVGTGRERQYTTVSVLPPILQIHVARAQYDKEKASLFKSNHHLAFPEVLFMDRYVDDPNDTELQQRRAESWAWKRELAALEKQAATLQTTSLGIDMPDALRSMAAYLDQLAPAASSKPAPHVNTIDALAGTVPAPPPKDQPDSSNPNDDDNDDDDDPIFIPPTLAPRLEAAAARAAAARTDLDARCATLRAQIGSQFADRRARPYRLHAVFIHRGLATSGHYWIYIHDFAGHCWRRYNDGYVSPVDDPAHEILETEDTARPATSSFLVYVREGHETELTDAVCRDVVAAAPSSSPPAHVYAAADATAGGGDGLSWATATGGDGDDGSTTPTTAAADGATDAQGDHVMGDGDGGEPARGRPNGLAARATEPWPPLGSQSEDEAARVRAEHTNVRW